MINLYLEKEREALFNDKVTKESKTKKNKFLEVTSDYDFIERNKFFSFITDNIFLSAFKIIARLFYFNLIKGKENLKSLKNTSFISVSNHVLYLDNLLVNASLKRRKTYILAEEENFIKGFPSRIFKAAKVLPIPKKIKPFLNLFKTLKNILNNNKNCIHIFAEKEMWPRYKKPRPMIEGAFSFAYDLNKPILPIFLEIKSSKNSKIVYRVITHILEPVYIDKTIENKLIAINDLRDRVEKMLVNKYYEVFKLKESDSLYNIDSKYLSRLEEHKEILKRCKPL